MFLRSCVNIVLLFGINGRLVLEIFICEEWNKYRDLKECGLEKEGSS